MESLTKPSGPALWNALLEQIRGEPLRRKILLAPSGMTALMTQRELARRSETGLPGVKANSYQSQYRTIWSGTNPNENIEDTPLDTILENFLRRNPSSVLERTAYDKGEIPFPGLASGLANAIEDLHLHGVDRTRIEKLDELDPGLTSDDSLGLLKTCTLAVEEYLGERNTVVPSQIAARLDALATDELEQGLRHDLYVCLYPDELYGHEKTLLDRIDQTGADVVKGTAASGTAADHSRDPARTNLEKIQHHLFREGSPEVSWDSDDDTVTFYSTPDRDHEIEAIVSHLVNRALDEEEDLRFSDVAIVSPDASDLLRFREALKAVDVDCFVAADVSLLKTNVGKALRSYLRMFRDHFRRDRVMDFLTNPSVSLKPFREIAKETIEHLGITEEQLNADTSMEEFINSTLSPSRWNRYSKKADVDRGIRSGDNDKSRVPAAPFAFPSPWLHQLEVFEHKAFQKRGKAYLKSAVEDGSDFLSNYSVHRIVFSRCLRRFIKDINRELTRENTGEFISGVIEYFETYIDETSEAPFGSVHAPDSRWSITVWTRLRESLRETVRQVDWEGYERGEAVRRLEEGVTEFIGIGERMDSGGVFLGTPDATRGRTYQKLFVTGLNERSFPTVTREDPFLNDAHREEVEVRPLSHEQREHQRNVFRELIQSLQPCKPGNDTDGIPELVLSYRRSSSDGGGSMNMPSSFYISCYDLFLDTTWSDFEDAVGGEEEDYVLTPVSIKSTPGELKPITPSEAGLRELERRYDDAGEGESEISVPNLDEISEHSAFKRAVEKEATRFGSPKWGPESACFDGGGLGEKIANMYFGENSETGVASPTRIGKFLECPRKFLFDRVLDFEDEDSPPEELDSPDNKGAGSIIHELLEKIFQHFEDEHIYTTSNSLGNLEEKARPIFEKTVETYNEQTHTGLPFMWRQAYKEYFDMIHKVLEAYEEEDWVPMEYEFSTYGSIGDLLKTFLDQYLNKRMEDADVVERESAQEKLLAMIGRSTVNADRELDREFLPTSVTAGDLRDKFRNWYRQNRDDEIPETVTLHEGENHEITFGGRIDRIDEHKEDSANIRVVDYKSGKSDKYQNNRFLSVKEKDDTEKQMHQIQLPVYRMLAEKNMDDRTVLNSIYMFLGDGGDLKKLGIEQGWDELREAFEKSMMYMYQTLKSGEFPADFRCRYCSCDTICGTTGQRKHLMENVKAGDDLQYDEFREAATRYVEAEEDQS